GKFERVNNWVLDTDGCNLEEVLTCPRVDATRTTSNDITEIFAVLGIEAVRRALLRELRAVISFDGSYVNYRHLAVLCDSMTQKGYLMSITRHGINRVEKGPLKKCSFEETVEILMEAAIFAETDHLRGVTENIMLGQLCPLGTGDVDLLIDEEKLRDVHRISTHTIQQQQEGNNNSSLEGFILSNNNNLDNNNLISSPDGSNTSPSPHGLSSIFSPMPFSTVYSSFAQSPSNPLSPSSPSAVDGNIVDTQALGGKFSPPQQTPRSPTSPVSPLSCFSPREQHNPMSPIMQGCFSPSSPLVTTGLDTVSPSYSPSSPLQSPYYQPTYSVQSPRYSPTSPLPGASSPTYGEGAQEYSPTSPAYEPADPFSPNPYATELAQDIELEADPDANAVPSPSSPQQPAEDNN
ncbi:DNA-directed RNA polymerase II largest subunit, putative, partial [Eimeria maxima]